MLVAVDPRSHTSNPPCVLQWGKGRVEGEGLWSRPTVAMCYRAATTTEGKQTDVPTATTATTTEGRQTDGPTMTEGRQTDGPTTTGGGGGGKTNRRTDNGVRRRRERRRTIVRE